MEEQAHADVHVEEGPKTKAKQQGGFRVIREGKHRYIQTPFGTYPMGAWWALVATLILLPIVPFALLFWLAGWVIGLRFRDQPQPPKDAMALKWLGRSLFKVVWLPQMIYFRFNAPVAYQDWQRRTVSAGIGIAKKAEAQVSNYGAKVMFGEDEPRRGEAPARGPEASSEQSGAQG